MSGVEIIAVERRRQVEVERFTPERDRACERGTLSRAGAAYALSAAGALWPRRTAPAFWPWAEEAFKPREMERDLARCGALIAAELDRLLAVQGRPMGRPQLLEAVEVGRVVKRAEERLVRDGDAASVLRLVLAELGALLQPPTGAGP